MWLWLLVVVVAAFIVLDSELVVDAGAEWNKFPDDDMFRL